MNLQDQIMEELSTQMQSEIDFSILSDMLVQGCGWKKVTLPRFFNRQHSIDVLMWCEEHVKHPYEHRSTSFVFENEGDAINFTLKWK